MGLILAAGHLWLVHAQRDTGYPFTVLHVLLIVATGAALSFTPTTTVIASGMPDSHAGLVSGLAGSTTGVEAALEIAGFTAIGMSAGLPNVGAPGPTSFSPAFTASAVVALAATALGLTMDGTRGGMTGRASLTQARDARPRNT